MAFKSICNKHILHFIPQFESYISNGTKSLLFRKSPFSDAAHANYSISSIFPELEKHKQHKGPKTNVIITHGIFGEERHWRFLSRESSFTNGLSVGVYELRNHGNQNFSKEFNYHLLAKDLLKHMNSDKPKSSKYTLMGHCIGGRAMMATALYNPEKIEKLIIIDASPLPMPPEFREYLKYLKAMQTVKFGHFFMNSDISNDALKDVVVDPFIRNFIVQNTDSDGKTCLEKWKMNVDSLIENFETGIMDFPQGRMGLKFEGETHFIYGSLSNHIKMPDDEEEIRKIFPNAQFHEVYEAGHFLFQEEPQQFKSIIYPLIKGIPYENYSIGTRWNFDIMND